MSDTAATSGPAADHSSRSAILVAARLAFGRSPYEAVTLRGIAAAAGVSPALIVKHFGGKEQLYDRVLDFAPAVETLLAAPVPALGEHMVRQILLARRARAGDPLLRVIWGIGAADERRELLSRFSEQVVTVLADRIGGPPARLTADLVLAQLIGLGVMISVDAGGPLWTMDIPRLAEVYGAPIQALIDAQTRSASGEDSHSA